MLLIGVDGISFLLGIDDKEKNVFDFLKIIYYFYHCFHIFVFYKKLIFILKKKNHKNKFLISISKTILE